MAANSFTEFCQMKRLSTETINILSENGFSDTSDLALLSDADIDSNFTGPLLLAQRLRLKAVVKELQSGGTAAQCDAGPRSGLITRTYFELPPRKETVVRIVLLGRTGAGKSATGNTILGREEFRSKAAITSQTQVLSKKFVKLDDLAVCVVDTPGLSDVERTSEEVEDEITRCVTLCLPGPHCLIMVIKYGRITEPELVAYLKIKAMFGDDVKNYMILVITGGDEMTTDIVQTLQQDDADLSPFEKNLKTVFSDVSGRCIVINNKAKTEEKDPKVRDLMRMVTGLMTTHSPDYFHGEVIDRVQRAFNTQVQRLALAEGIDVEEARRRIIQTLNDEKKAAVLRAISIAAGIGGSIAATAGLTLVTGGAFGIAAVALGAGSLLYEKACSLM